MKFLPRVLNAALFATIAMASVALAAPRNDNNQGSNQNQGSSNYRGSGDNRSTFNDQDINNNQNNNNKDRNNPSDESHPASTGQQAFLGVAVSTLDDSLRSHLKNQVSDGSGVLVQEVAEGSPAAKAGLKQHDILVSLDDQRLYSPEQLVRLIESDKPGRKVKLHVIRNGKSQDLEATLGSHPMHGGQAHTAYRWPTTSQSGDRGDPSGRGGQSNQQENQWQNFDAMTLSRVGKNKFKAEIRYRDNHGNVASHHFQGAPDELRHDIEGEKDMPRAERDRLLQALNIATGLGGVEFQEYDLSNQR